MPATSSKMSINFQNITESSVEHENNKKRKAENSNLISETAINIESGKKIKWNCDDHSSDQAEAASASVAVSQNDAQSPVAMHRNRRNAPKPDRVPREKCKYGTQCYR